MTGTEASEMLGKSRKAGSCPCRTNSAVYKGECQGKKFPGDRKMFAVLSSPWRVASLWGLFLFLDSSRYRDGILEF